MTHDPMQRDPSTTSKPASAGIGQRLFALFVFAFLAYLIWLALTGQYDTQVNRVAAWLHRHYASLLRGF